MADGRTDLSRLPSVDRLLKHPALVALEPSLARTIVVRAVREVLDEARAVLVGKGGGRNGASATEEAPTIDILAGRAAERAGTLSKPRLRRVMNATGIVVHTNLGRSLLSERAVAAVADAARNYVTLEYDVTTGSRASRQDVVRGLLTELTGAEDVLVVNNNAAAVLVALNSLADGREVVISRGELVEIGGSFRLPDVMAKSGALMVEVGTTNRTRLSDYERAITDRTGALLKVHRSNFAVRGFVAEAGIEELSGLARARGIPLIHDLGSGALVNFEGMGSAHETMPRESLAAGASVVTFSGDKLLGGPQAGIIAGEAPALARIAANPLMRAIRVEKLVLAALEATLASYRDGFEHAAEEIPTLAMIRQSREAIEMRARALGRILAGSLGSAATVEIVPGESEAGGGSLPGEGMATAIIALRPGGMSAETLTAALRGTDPPVIAFIREDAVLFDLRTIPAAEDRLLASLIEQAARDPRREDGADA